MALALFRSEVTEPAQARWLGHDCIERPLSSRVVTFSIVRWLQSPQSKERQAQGELVTAQLREQFACKSLTRGKDKGLATNGFVAAVQIQQRQNELLDLQLHERRAERTLQSLHWGLQAARADKVVIDTPTQPTLVQLKRALASLDQEATANDSRIPLLITAPRPRRISALPVNAGQSLHEAIPSPAWCLS